MLHVLLFVLGVLGVLLISFSLKPNRSEKILGVYTRPGKWYFLKFAVFYSILSIRKWKTKLKHKQGKMGDSGLGSSVHCNVDNLEQLQVLSDHKKAFDAVFFHAVNSEGFYLCGGTERRHEGKINALLYLIVPGLGLLCNEQLPKTLLDAEPVSLLKNDSYSAGGITFSMVKPMKMWRLHFAGRMRIHDRPDSFVNVKLECDWTSDFRYFLFDTSMSSKAIARAVARETWSKEYFDVLKTAHQTHYEQMGHLKGTLTLDGEPFPLEMKAFRDHSFGHKRDWSLMHRYIYHTVFLEDDTRISIGVISQPCTTSQLEVGYVVQKDKTVHPVDYCDLMLYQHGEDGVPSKDIAFTVVAGKKTYHVKAFADFQAEHFKGDDVEARLNEMFLRYEVNGVPGRGISEWQYNNLFKTVE